MIYNPVVNSSHTAEPSSTHTHTHTHTNTIHYLLQRRAENVSFYVLSYRSGLTCPEALKLTNVTEN